MTERVVTIPKISCAHCVRAIERAVGALDGVKTVAADQLSRLVKVEWDESKLDWEDIRLTLETAGYPPEA